MNTTDQWVGRGLPVLLIALIGVMVWLNSGRQAAPIVACPDLTRGCTVQVAGRAVSVGSDTVIRSLKPFRLRVGAPGAGKVQARFTMEGMDMGFNLYTLRPDGPGAFQATVTLPVCVTGRRDWLLTLDVDGAAAALPFVTDL